MWPVCFAVLYDLINYLIWRVELAWVSTHMRGILTYITFFFLDLRHFKKVLICLFPLAGNEDDGKKFEIFDRLLAVVVASNARDLEVKFGMPMTKMPMTATVYYGNATTAIGCV